jgi:thymidylate synthase
MRNGKKVAPRGLEITEIENYSYQLPPYVRFMSFKDRKLSIDYIKKEFLWYLKGDKHDVSIAEHAKMWKELINEDMTINSNYGQYLFGTTHQFENVVKILQKDKDSRRASIVILNKDHLLSNTKDVPCTYALNFRIRDNVLKMTVHMRSQDAIFGMGNDAPAFSFIHEMMYNILKLDYPDLTYGWYFHFADSFHIYSRHYEMTQAIIDGSEYVPVDCPKISGPLEVKFLLLGDYNIIPKEFVFTLWLLQQTLI